MAIGNDRIVSTQLRTLFNLGAIGDLTDGQLLERFATDHGEAAELAFAVLVERHGPMVLRVCRGVLVNPDDTQDAFQATFLVLVKKARALWVRDSLGPWLFQVAYRTASCARSSAARRRRHERHAATPATASYDELGGRAGDELGRVVHEEIDRLPERYRAALVLCDLEGRSHEQAARHLGWPVGTVKSRQARGRERLRNRLSRRGLAPNALLLATALSPDVCNALVPPALVDATTRAAVQFLTVRTIVRGSALAQGVLRSMSITRWLKVASVLLVLGAAAGGAGLLAGKGSSGVEPRPEQDLQAPRSYEGPLYAAKRGRLIVTVSEPGNLESARNQDVYSNVEGVTTIISILPEGARVKKTDVVCMLDSAALNDRLINQRITTVRAEAARQNATLAREVAEIAVREYTEGIYKSEQETLKGEIAAARSASARADSRLVRTQRARQRLIESLAATKGARTPADIVAELDIEDRIDASEQVLEREKRILELAKTKQELLEQYTRGKTIKALQSDVMQKRSDELAKGAAWELEKSKAAKLEKQIAACTITAPGDGIVVYANNPLPIGSHPQIEEGAQVRERQKIFSLPDISRLQVDAKVGESQISKIAPNMQATIRVDAFADQLLNGRVVQVAPLPASTNRSYREKVYSTKVAIANPLPGLRPGMLARVEILVTSLDDVLSVPVQAVLRYDDADHVAVKKPGGGFEWRDVTLGISNDKLVEVKLGIQAGEIVALNPAALMSDDEKRAEKIGAPTQPATRPDSPR